jgi:hypothetical protein
MIEFFKRLFSSAPTATPAPYKVEASNTVVEQATQAVVESIVPAQKPAKTKAEKKPAAKAKTARKPRASKS